MTIQDLILTLENGATKLTIYEPNTGEIHFAGIWFNELKQDVLSKTVKHIQIDRYTMRVEVE